MSHFVYITSFILTTFFQYTSNSQNLQMDSFLNQEEQSRVSLKAVTTN